jgi:integrase
MCKRCCKWLINKSLLEENYAAQARIRTEIADEYDHKREEELKNRKKVFSYEDIQKFYDAYKNNMGQYPVVVLFLLETGMRAGEFSSLRNSNIDLEKNRIDIVETNAIRYKNNDKNNGVEFYTKVPKNKEARFVMMSDLCRECVIYMQTQTKLYCKNNPDDLLYPTFRNGKRRSTSSMEVCFKELCNKLNIDRDVHLTKTGQQKGLCLHSLRHTADTIANTAKGANIVNTALAMGHKAITVENIYTHATEDALKTITTPSQVVLKDYSTKDIVDESKERELYEMYIKLKEKFENQES